MRFLPMASVVSVVLLMPALTAGCTGDDNTLPLPPSDGSADATRRDGESPDTGTVRPDAGGDAAGGGGKFSSHDGSSDSATDAVPDDQAAFDSGANAVEAMPPDTSAEPADASDSG
jgi:hypothetical protein